MRVLVRTLWLLVFLCLAPTTAWAQVALAGVVTDNSGAVLPGVTVEASSPALIEKVRTATTDSSGRYRIESLQPGQYTVTFSLTGFAPLKREHITLTGSGVLTINGELKVGGCPKPLRSPVKQRPST